MIYNPRIEVDYRCFRHKLLIFSQNCRLSAQMASIKINFQNYECTHLRIPPYSQRPPTAAGTIQIMFIFARVPPRAWKGVNRDLRYWKSKDVMFY